MKKRKEIGLDFEVDKMKKRKKTGLDFEVDKLTNSIENVQTGDSFQTDVTPLSNLDLKNITKKNNWQFNWRFEQKQPEREVYKLTIVNNLSIVQGLISLEVKSDSVYMHLIESAPFNKGKTKVYAGIPGNLVAYACRLSLLRGFDGNVSFISKTRLIDHYIKTLGATYAGGQVMFIEPNAALNLINKYFKILEL